MVLPGITVFVYAIIKVRDEQGEAAAVWLSEIDESETG